MITNRTTKTLSSLRFSVLLVACSSRQYNGITAFIVYYLVLMPSDVFFKVLAHFSLATNDLDAVMCCSLGEATRIVVLFLYDYN